MAIKGVEEREKKTTKMASLTTQNQLFPYFRPRFESKFAHSFGGVFTTDKPDENSSVLKLN